MKKKFFIIYEKEAKPKDLKKPITEKEKYRNITKNLSAIPAESKSIISAVFPINILYFLSKKAYIPALSLAAVFILINQLKMPIDLLVMAIISLILYFAGGSFIELFLPKSKMKSLELAGSREEALIKYIDKNNLEGK